MHTAMAKIDEEGVSFKSVIDGSAHRFTPERSMEIQHNIGADLIFAFDECTSPLAPYEYQREAMDRTHRWAERSLRYHKNNVKREGGKKDGGPQQALLGIVQGGRHEDLRKESAKIIGAMNVDGVEFDGFGIGGSFDKEDMYSVVFCRRINRDTCSGSASLRTCLAASRTAPIFSTVSRRPALLAMELYIQKTARLILTTQNTKRISEKYTVTVLMVAPADATPAKTTLPRTSHIFFGQRKCLERRSRQSIMCILL